MVSKGVRVQRSVRSVRVWLNEQVDYVPRLTSFIGVHLIATRKTLDMRRRRYLLG